MSTYVIGDLHGNLSTFKALLNKIDFKYDGSDTLYLLGDYMDWGKESINTLIFVKELTDKYIFVHPILGNHDLMFLEYCREFFETGKESYDFTWTDYNGGDVTLSQFLELDKKTQTELLEFVDNMPYRIDVEVNEKKYLLAHACPEKFYDREKEHREFIYARDRAVWDRIHREVPNVIKYFDKDNVFDNFICGHTIVDNACLDKPYNHIINNPNNCILIDCGGKILGNSYFYHYKYARLAALRLDDFEEFYQEYVEKETS